MSSLKQIPNFRSDIEEVDFWEKHDSAEYADWSKAQKTVFPNLKNSTAHESLSERRIWQDINSRRVNFKVCSLLG